MEYSDLFLTGFEAAFGSYRPKEGPKSPHIAPPSVFSLRRLLPPVPGPPPAHPPPPAPSQRDVTKPIPVKVSPLSSPPVHRVIVVSKPNARRSHSKTSSVSSRLSWVDEYWSEEARMKRRHRLSGDSFQDSD